MQRKSEKINFNIVIKGIRETKVPLWLHYENVKVEEMLTAIVNIDQYCFLNRDPLVLLIYLDCYNLNHDNVLC